MITNSVFTDKLSVVIKEGGVETNISIPAKRCTNNRHLFIHNSFKYGSIDLDRKAFSVSHYLGMAVAVNLGTYGEALGLVKLISPLIDWNFSTLRQAEQINFSKVSIITHKYKDLLNEGHTVNQCLVKLSTVGKFPWEEEEQALPTRRKSEFENSKVDMLVESFGFSTVGGLLKYYMHQSVVPAICMNDGCNYTTDYEPDCSSGYCEECRTKSVKSIMVIEGLM